MSYFVMPSFEERDFVCNDCGRRFKGKDTDIGKKKCLAFFYRVGFVVSIHIKCPECGSINTQPNPCISY